MGFVFHQTQINPDFFNLRTGLADDILQKASNYGISFGIVGNSEELESNKTGQVLFKMSVQEVLDQFL